MALDVYRLFLQRVPAVSAEHPQSTYTILTLTLPPGYNVGAIAIRDDGLFKRVADLPSRVTIWRRPMRTFLGPQCRSNMESF